ncbi:MAG: hypothetical protein JAY73_14770, partial [Candidatus Thiodiazotropha taylori]|nr:hypothetical protein [Candidatus Thiodiazotropha taylori]
CFFICHFLFLNETTQYGMQIKCHAVSKRFYKKKQLVMFCHSEKDNFLTLNNKPTRQFSVSCFLGICFHLSGKGIPAAQAFP